LERLRSPWRRRHILPFRVERPSSLQRERGVNLVVVDA